MHKDHICDTSCCNAIHRKVKNVVEEFQKNGKCNDPGQVEIPLFDSFDFDDSFLDILHLCNRIGAKLKKKFVQEVAYFFLFFCSPVLSSNHSSRFI